MRSNADRWTWFINIVAFSMSGIAAITAIFSFFSSPLIFKEDSTAKFNYAVEQLKNAYDSSQQQQFKRLSQLETERGRQERYIRELQVTIDSIGGKIIRDPLSQNKINLELYNKAMLNNARMNERFDSLDARLKALEDALMQTPAKALSVPLLQRDLDALKATEAKDIIDTKAGVANVYDLSKWFIGLMFTLSIAIIGLAINNFIPKKEKASINNKAQHIQNSSQ